MCALILPEPTYSGPENITYFRTVAGLDEELERDKKVTWIVTFYTAWNPACVAFAPIFAQLSHEYVVSLFYSHFSWKDTAKLASSFADSLVSVL